MPASCFLTISFCLSMPVHYSLTLLVRTSHWTWLTKKGSTEGLIIVSIQKGLSSSCSDIKWASELPWSSNMPYLVHVLFKQYYLSNVDAQNQSLFKQCNLSNVKNSKSGNISKSGNEVLKNFEFDKIIFDTKIINPGRHFKPLLHSSFTLCRFGAAVHCCSALGILPPMLFKHKAYMTAGLISPQLMAWKRARKLPRNFQALSLFHTCDTERSNMHNLSPKRWNFQGVSNQRTNKY